MTSSLPYSRGFVGLAAVALLAACTASVVRPSTPTRPPQAPDVHALFARALAAQEDGHLDQAEALWKELIVAAPNRAAPHTNLGIVYRTTGRLEDAIHEYDTAIQLDPTDAITYHNLGVAQRARGAWSDAEEAYLRALKLRPGQTATHYNLGILYELFLDRPEDALAQYRATASLGGPEAEAVTPWIRTLERRLAQRELHPEAAP